MPMGQEGIDVRRAEDGRLPPDGDREGSASSGRPPTTSCLINNHNYGRYVHEAVDSALAQTVPFDEVVVVDDGSTDGSQELLLGKYGQDPRVRLVLKANGGQLSAFHAGLAHSSGEVVFFLDADDRYHPARVERTLQVFSDHPACEAVLTPVILFGNRSGIASMRDSRGRYIKLFETPEPYGHFGGREITVELTAYCREVPDTEWVGSPTSGLAVSRRTLLRFLPLPPALEPEWKTRADDCIVFGLSLANAVRIYLHSPLVEYRIHGENLFAGRGKEAKRLRERKVEVLLEALRERLGLPSKAERAPQEAIEILAARSPNLLKAFERAWRLPRKAGVPSRECLRVRMRLLRDLLGHMTGARRKA